MACHVEEHRLRVFKNRMLRTPERDEVTGGWWKLHNEKSFSFHETVMPDSGSLYPRRPLTSKCCCTHRVAGFLNVIRAWKDGDWYQQRTLHRLHPVYYKIWKLTWCIIILEMCFSCQNLLWCLHNLFASVMPFPLASSQARLGEDL
jgi:hypothetical protein